MSTQIFCSLLFIFIAGLWRFLVLKSPVDKTKAGWISFVFAVFSTTLCTLMYNGEPQDTVITGFVTMLITYNILSVKQS